jgi:hypothetical protein
LAGTAGARKQVAALPETARATSRGQSAPSSHRRQVAPDRLVEIRVVPAHRHPSP